MFDHLSSALHTSPVLYLSLSSSLSAHSSLPSLSPHPSSRFLSFFLVLPLFLSVTYSTPLCLSLQYPLKPYPLHAIVLFYHPHSLVCVHAETPSVYQSPSACLEPHPFSRTPLHPRYATNGRCYITGSVDHVQLLLLHHYFASCI